MIFNEKSFYNPGEVNLLQIIKEPMIETTLELIALKHISAMQIGDSDSESEVDIPNLPTQLTENQLGKQAEQHLNHLSPGRSDHEDYLPTPGTTPAPSTQSSIQSSSPAEDTPTDTDKNTITLILLNIPRTAPQALNTYNNRDLTLNTHDVPNIESRLNEVSVSLDTDNILTERIRKKRKSKK